MEKFEIDGIEVTKAEYSTYMTMGILAKKEYSLALRERYAVQHDESLRHLADTGTNTATMAKARLMALRDLPAEPAVASSVETTSALQVQEGGGHYKDMQIQPVEYSHANKLPFIEGCVVKYVSRHRVKNGKGDIKKAIHFLHLLLELEYGEKCKSLP